MTSLLFGSHFSAGPCNPRRLAAQSGNARGRAQDRAVRLADGAAISDMFPLTRQVQSACDTAKRATARLVGAEPPRFEDNEATFDELHDRIRRTSAYVESHAAEGFPETRTEKSR